MKKTMKYNKDQQLLYDAIFSDAWYKFVSHKDFPMFEAYVNLKYNSINKEEAEKQIKIIGEKILKEIGG